MAVVGFVLLLVSAPLDVDRLLASWPPLRYWIKVTLAVVATLIVLVSLIRGLGDGAPWAFHAVAPVCYVLIASGMVRLLLSLAGGGLLIPLEALAALPVLFLAYFIPLLIEVAGR